jgi:anaerobic magnesium-protoporphyrin IX monomethyl ester cyclase
MKIQFINPPYTTLAGIPESAGHMMPLCFGYLAAYVRQRIPELEFDITDAEALGLDIDGVLTRAAAFSADVVGITAPTPTIPYVARIARGLRRQNPRARIVLGGIHPSVMPEQTLAECPDVDFLVIGEGEESFADLVDNLLGRREGEVPGLWERHNGTVRATAPRAPIAALDALPFPARDLFDLSLYRSAPTKKVSDEGATPILTSRGCPYDCAHCPSKLIWNRRVRYRSTQNVVDEIETCVTHFDLREFNFFDDTFTLNRQRVHDICSEILRRGLTIYWICFARANTLDAETVALMKKAGCRKISIGFESGHQGILDLMRKGTLVEDGRRTARIIRAAGVAAHGSFMLGNVGETEATIRETIRYAKSLDLDNATFFITTPYPGTDLFAEASRLGSIDDETPWQSFAPLTNAKPILVQHNVSPDRLQYWQRRAFREFYLRPRYLVKKLRSAFSPSGIRVLAEGLRILVRILRRR